MAPVKAKIRRGELRLHTEGNDGSLVHVWLGEPHDPESDHILTLHKHYIKDLVAILKAYESGK